MGSRYSSRDLRNSQERDRRMRMKDLYSRLASVLPPHPTKLTASELVAEATCYINDLKERIKAKEQRKELLKMKAAGHEMTSTADLRLPQLNIRIRESTLQVSLICELNKNFMLHEVLRVLQEEGAEVLSVALHKFGPRAFYGINSQAFSPRVGIATSRVQERLEDLIFC